MRAKTIFLSVIIGLVSVGCNNLSQKQQATQETQQEYPLKNIFNRIYTEAIDDYKKAVKDEAKSLERYALNTDTIYKVFQDSVVKDKIISLKTLSYYNMILDRFFYDMNTTCAYISNNGGYDYSILLYTCYGDVRMDKPSTILTYNPNTDKLDIETTIDGRVVQSNGEVYYNTEGWHLGIDEYKNDFDEVVKREPVASYKIDGEDSYSQYKFAIVLRLYVITLWTNELGELYEIKDIRIKDNESDKIYNVSFDDPYRHGQRVMNDNIGVYMYGENAAGFINLVSSLNNYTISIKGVYEGYEENVVIKNPENLSNIKDVYMKLLQKQEEIDNQK